MLPATKASHEGIAYLLGVCARGTTLAVAAIRPEAKTTRGSFEVSSLAMARVVRAAADVGLQTVGQVHTHPGAAYHSDGDVEGTHITYDGFVSIVLPDYGRRLPALEGMAAYIYRSGKGFSELTPSNISIVTARIS